MKNFLLFLMMALFLFACDPDDGTTPGPDPDPEPTKRELATRSWKVVTVSVGTTTLDAANYSFQFNENDTFSISAPDVDDPDFPDAGNWELISNDQIIRLNGSVNLNVITLTEEELILEYSYQNFKEGTVTFRFEMIPA